MRTVSRAFIGALLVAVAVPAAVNLLAQSPGAAKPPGASTAASKHRTPWGDPDLQGIWSNATTTPFERPASFGDKAVLSNEERAELAPKVADQLNVDRQVRPGGVVPYNEFWFERGTLSNQTSLVVDPPDGKLPPFTPEGQKRWDARRPDAAGSHLDRSSYERCISRGMPGAMMPGFYNHNYQILQSPGYVAILVEMIHDARIIRLDGAPHVNGTIRQWLGDSRGRWEGSTLVVETTNLNDKVFERGGTTGYGGNLKMIERFTRISDDRIDYRFTIDAPTIFTKPWTVSTPMQKIKEPIYEYACHEGNYAMPGILAGARTAEREASEQR
jgi:hypothetical protein